MELFWKRGYDATTLPDLQAAMGNISPPSFYAAFGSKEQVFAEAVALYRDEVACGAARELQDGATARESIEGFLRESLKMLTAASTPRGCLMLVGALNSTNAAADKLLREQRGEGQELIRQRIRRGIADGDIPKGADVDAITAFYVTVAHGLSISARDGVPAATLGRVIDGAISAWNSLTATTTPRKRAKRRQ